MRSKTYSWWKGITGCFNLLVQRKILKRSGEVNVSCWFAARKAARAWSSGIHLLESGSCGASRNVGRIRRAENKELTSISSSGLFCRGIVETGFSYGGEEFCIGDGDSNCTRLQSSNFNNSSIHRLVNSNHRAPIKNLEIHKTLVDAIEGNMVVRSCDPFLNTAFRFSARYLKRKGMAAQAENESRDLWKRCAESSLVSGYLWKQGFVCSAIEEETPPINQNMVSTITCRLLSTADKYL